MKYYHKNRLLKVAELLKTIPFKKFDLSDWKREDSCGTVCCAVGHACSIPSFKKAGLKLILSDERENYKLYQLYYKNMMMWDAVSNFFGITEEEAEDLFSSAGYISKAKPKDVIKNIKDFLKFKEGK